MEGGGGVLTAAEAEATVRIYVGGLGESVSGDDVRKIFTPFGGIESMEFIRTKGRSFAYINFFPTSPKSLSKLFSTYNGCVWKGGRLRLEKAKEHYLARLRREWEEDALLASSASPTDVDVLADKKMESSEKPKKDLSSEKKQLRIYFPRLGKLKSIPFSGTGKHKYSFRRVEVPSLPTHFCDCEEHSGALHATEEKQIPSLEEQDGGIDEEEINLMNYLMNKLLKRENVSNTARGENELAKKGDNSIKAIDDLLLDENDGDSTADEDNLVLNIVSRGQKMVLANQESSFNKSQLPKDGPTQSVPKLQRRNASPTNKKRKSVQHEENDRNEYISAISEGERTKEGNNSIKAIDVLHLDENEGDSTADEDNLVLNIVNQGQKMILGNQESCLNKSQVPKDGPAQSVPEMQRRNTSFPKKKRKSVFHEENDRNEYISAISGGKGHSLPHSNEPETLLGSQHKEPESGVKHSTPSRSCSQKASWREVAGDRGNSAFNISDNLVGISSGMEEQSKSDNLAACNDGESNKFLGHENQKDQLGKSKVTEGLTEAQPTKPDSASSQEGRGSAWLQKSSWTQLIGANNSNSFSIAQILPGITFEKKELAKPYGMRVPNSIDSKHCEVVEEGKSERTVNNTIDLGVGKESEIEMNEQAVMAISRACAPAAEKKHNSAAKHICTKDVAIGETCSFMRTAASLKEWADTKKAISGSHKRKNHEK